VTVSAPEATARGEGLPEGFEDPGIGGFVGCNPSGICHGGWLSTFADVQLVRQVFAEIGEDRPAPRTVSLSVDFLSAAMLGEWVDGSAELVRVTKTLAFVQGIARVGDRPLLRMNGIFSLRRPKSEA
jgi:acyl-coenzyme A thioesterase PaaI-like protein